MAYRSSWATDRRPNSSLTTALLVVTTFQPTRPWVR